MPVFLMLVGIPCSGKSTWREEFVKEAEGRFVAISSDDYIEKKAKLEGTTYDKVWKKYSKEAEKICIESAKFAVDNGWNIIWDQTNLTIKSRRKKLDLIPESYTKYVKYFPAPDVDELKRRLDSRPGKVIPDTVIVDMITRTEVPLLDEGFHGYVQ